MFSMIFEATIKLDSPTDRRWKADSLAISTIGDNVFELESEYNIYRCTELINLPLLLCESDVEVIVMGRQWNIPI